MVEVVVSMVGVGRLCTWAWMVTGRTLWGVVVRLVTT